MTKEEIKNKEIKLLELTSGFCTERLNDDYAQLCEKLILKMGRKRNVPFKSGRIEIWAAAVIYALGSINFLFDKSFEPYQTADQICDYFGTKKSTVSSKSRTIKDLLDIRHFDSDFSTVQINENNPFNDIVMVDGFIVPLSSIPEDLQEKVKKARAEGGDIEFTTR